MKLYRILFVLALFTAPVMAFEMTEAIKVRPLLKTSTSWDGASIAYPQGQAEITGLVIEIAAGGETGWHSHPVPSFGMVLEGTLAVTLQDGRVKELKAGDAVAEVIGAMHNGRVVGDRPVKLVVFYAGAVGQPLTLPAPR